jgi:hypothetical protein
MLARITKLIFPFDKIQSYTRSEYLTTKQVSPSTVEKFALV